MFKELGEFIDNVGRRAGFIAKKILSKDEPHEMCGDIYIDINEIDLEKEIHGLVKQELPKIRHKKK